MSPVHTFTSYIPFKPGATYHQFTPVQVTSPSSRVLCHQFTLVQVASSSRRVLRITSSHSYTLHPLQDGCYVSPVHTCTSCILFKTGATYHQFTLVHVASSSRRVLRITSSHSYKLHPLQDGCYVSPVHTCTRCILFKTGATYHQFTLVHVISSSRAPNIIHLCLLFHLGLATKNYHWNTNVATRNCDLAERYSIRSPVQKYMSRMRCDSATNTPNCVLGRTT